MKAVRIKFHPLRIGAAGKQVTLTEVDSVIWSAEKGTVTIDCGTIEKRKVLTFDATTIASMVEVKVEKPFLDQIWRDLPVLGRLNLLKEVAQNGDLTKEEMESLVRTLPPLTDKARAKIDVLLERERGVITQARLSEAFDGTEPSTPAYGDELSVGWTTNLAGRVTDAHGKASSYAEPGSAARDLETWTDRWPAVFAACQAKTKTQRPYTESELRIRGK